MQESNLDQNPAVNVQSQNNSAEVKAPNPKNKLPIILAIIFLFIILGSGAYYYLGVKKTSNNKACPDIARICKDGSTAVPGPNCSQVCPEDAMSTTPTQKPITDETMNWKTYANAQYGFSLKYPNIWNQIDLTDKNSDYLPGVLLTPQLQKPQDEEKVINIPGVYIYTLEIKDCINSGDYSQKEMNTYINNKDLYPGLKIRKIDLNNIYGYIIDEGAPGVTAQKGPEAFIFQCPTEIQISFDPTGIDNSIKLFDKILSTFRFTN
ncbi:MAG: hypothetical protein Q7K55_05950 [Candidatus Levybacteria bacterium]|nr:hypothetical protein [Candidatus Levybacteria bacterium]